MSLKCLSLWMSNKMPLSPHVKEGGYISAENIKSDSILSDSILVDKYYGRQYFSC